MTPGSCVRMSTDLAAVSVTATGTCALCGAPTAPAEQFCGGDRCRAVFMPDIAPARQWRLAATATPHK